MANTARIQTVVEQPRPTRSETPGRLRAVHGLVLPCSTSTSRPSSLPFQSDEGAGWHEDDLVARNIRIRKGAVLFHGGDPFTALFAVRTGCCKSVVTTSSGQEQIAGFHIEGEILGCAAICGNTYDETVMALEDSEFREMPFERVEALAQANGDFQRKLRALLSREIRRERTVSLWLATMRAEQRIASFLLDLADRYGARGYSSRELILRMTRDEIGFHLGLSHETVSRLVSRFHQHGLIHVQGRVLTILDRFALKQLCQDAAQQ